MGTGERSDAPSPSILDFHTNEFANRVGRHVDVAAAAEGNPVEPETVLRRREDGIPCEYFERRGARGEFQDGGIRAVGDIDGALGVNRDVIAERVRAGQQDAAFSIPRLEVEALQCAPYIIAGCGSSQRTQVVRAGPERVRCLVCEDYKDRARARCARSDEYGALGCARFDANDSTVPDATDIKRTIRGRRDALWKGFHSWNGN